MRKRPEDRMLDIFIGRWINEGWTVAGSDAPSVEILTSDVYEWGPGGAFVLHSAYGRIGDLDVGGVEILRYDQPTGAYRSEFFDSRGNAMTSELGVDAGAWTWRAERTRCTATFSEDGRIQKAHHERSEDGVTWEPSMEVTLRKIE
ncbi:MAG TPA: DUF1579 family protein [Chloroflexota bacterium]